MMEDTAADVVRVFQPLPTLLDCLMRKALVTEEHMKRTSCFVETAITSLVAILFLTNLACVKRIPIPADTPEIKSYMDIVYVHLKPGKQYLGKSFLAVKNPKLEDEYLMGKRRNKEIKIPLDDIDVIEVNRFDAKKTVIVSLGVITFAAVGSWIARGIGRANVD